MISATKFFPFALFALLATSCGQNQNSGLSTNNGQLGAGGTTAPFDTSKLSGALDQIPTSNSDQGNAVSQAKNGVDNVQSAAGALTKGHPSALNQYDSALQALGPIGQLLNEAGLASLGRELVRRGLMVPIYRFYNPTLYRHFYAATPSQAAAALQQGFTQYQGIGFYLYSTPFEDCSSAMYLGYDPVGNYYGIANGPVDPSFNHRVNEGVMGYGCPSPRPDAQLQIIGLSNGREPLTTVHPELEPPTDAPYQAQAAFPVWAPN